MTTRAMPHEIEWPTLAMLGLAYGAFAAGTLLWPVSGVLSVIVTALAIAQFSSLQHEVLHGHPFRNQTLSEALVFPGITLFVPYLRFKDLHLQHHFDPALTDPYDDPESNYLDPAVWARMLWVPPFRPKRPRAGPVAVGRRQAVQSRVCRWKTTKSVARVAKLVDAPGLGPDGGNTVGVRVPPRAPHKQRIAVPRQQRAALNMNRSHR